jgi:hypothetical protein
MGTFPAPHRSSAFPIHLDLVIPSGRLDQNDTSLFVFVLTNVGPHSVRVPISIDVQSKRTHVLILGITSEDGRFQGLVPPCAELFGQNDNPATFVRLLPGRSLVVHAPSRYVIPIGRLSLVGHVECLALSNGTSFFGTCDAS